MHLSVIRRRKTDAVRLQLFYSLLFLALVFGTASSLFSADSEDFWKPNQASKAMIQYFQHMTQPKPFTVRTGEDFKSHCDMIRRRMLKDMNLDPLPERIDLDPHYSEPIDHPWCVIRRVAIQLWPGVYSRGLLYMPKNLPEKPAPAVLCPHGHEVEGYADVDLQKRFLMLAKLGFVVFVTPQDHHEDLPRGFSNQTYMVWDNMRGLDFLQSLPEVDRNRLGVTGLSGGGLQSQMLVALDSRLKAATIAGMTCEYREILGDNWTHCHCNHWPNIMSYTDQPEITMLGFPAAIQYLTMNDWTATFAANDFPTIQTIYRENGHPDKTEVVYWPTPHTYDKPKRERTYWWMEKWVRGNRKAVMIAEPDDIQIVEPHKRLYELKVDVPHERTFEDYIREVSPIDCPALADADAWKAYRTKMSDALGRLLGDAQKRPPLQNSSFREIKPAWAEGLEVEEFLVASEDNILIPGYIIYPPEGIKPASMEIHLSVAGRAAVEKTPQPYLERARQGAAVVLADLRFSGDYSAKRLAEKRGDPNSLAVAWDRNGALWGRPVAGLMVTDLECVIDYLAKDRGVNAGAVQVTARDDAPLALASLLAACHDARITVIDVDFVGRSYGKSAPQRNSPEALPLVCNILQYGDILQWAALLADRQVTLHRVPQDDAARHWLEDAFQKGGKRENLKIVE
jgi:dienelactone hydrolase